jgi:hypothetical protein
MESVSGLCDPDPVPATKRVGDSKCRSIDRLLLLSNDRLQPLQHLDGKCLRGTHRLHPFWMVPRGFDDCGHSSENGAASGAAAARLKFGAGNLLTTGAFHEKMMFGPVRKRRVTSEKTPG